MNKHCYDIHHTLAIDYINGQTSIGACCQSGRIQVQEQSLNRLWNNTELMSIRELNLQNQLSESFCSNCTNFERAGVSSRRIKTAEFYQGWDSKKTGIRSMDVKLGNLCNLKCTICGPESSTAWIPDAVKMGIYVNPYNHYDKNYNKDLQLTLEDPAILDNLEMIKFWGGEPLLNEKHADILEFLDQAGLLKNCRVIYNTNGTHRVSDRVLDIWSRAHLVEIYFSIDDIESRFEYQRFGASWSEVEKNLRWYYDSLPSNHLFYIQCFVSYLNLMYLPELFDWKRSNFDTNRMQDPVNICLGAASGVCSSQRIPKNLRNFLDNKFKNYPELEQFLNFCQFGPPNCQKRFVDYVTRLDTIRQTDWKKTFPELAQLLND